MNTTETISQELQTECAKWLIVGFKRSWTMAMLASQMVAATGVQPRKLPFMAAEKIAYGKAPVRGFVSENYPKLCAFLDSNQGAILISAASQIVKLTPKTSRPSGSITRKERGFFTAERKLSGAVSQSYGISRRHFKSANGSDWNTCK
jgi:hypothetical protein